MSASPVRPRARDSSLRGDSPAHWLACMELVEDVLCVVSLVYVGHQWPVVSTVLASDRSVASVDGMCN